jgi:serine/threonine-protein kinase
VRVVPTQVRPVGSGSSACLTWVLGFVLLLALLAGAFWAATSLPGLVTPGPTPTSGPIVLPSPGVTLTPGFPTAGPAPTDTPAPPTATSEPPSPTPELATVPNFVGLSFDQAQLLAAQQGLQAVKAEEVPDENAPAGTVIRQNPAVNTRLAPGSQVNLTVSSGLPAFALPNVINTDGNQARSFLESQGLQVTVQEEANGAVQVGAVIRTDPDPGAQVRRGDTVTLYVSLGDLVTVPNVIGQKREEAIAAIQQAGLIADAQEGSVGQWGAILAQVAPGEVGLTQPEAGAQVQRGSRVILIVRRGNDEGGPPATP